MSLVRIQYRPLHGPRDPLRGSRADHLAVASIAAVSAKWKLSNMDMPSRSKWFEYSRARDMMLAATDSKHAPWHILHSDDKKRARLNCIHHILDLIPWKKLPREKVKLPKRKTKGAYDDQASLKGRKLVPAVY